MPQERSRSGRPGQGPKSGAKARPGSAQASYGARGGAGPRAGKSAAPGGKFTPAARPERGAGSAKPARPAGKTQRPYGDAGRPPRQASEAPLRDRRPREAEAALPGREAGSADIVFGRHAALAVLEGDQAVNKVWVLKALRNPELMAKIRQLAKEKGAVVQQVERPKLDALTFEGNHQGIVVSLSMADYAELETVIAEARTRPHPALLMLDGIEDPHNLGALIRTAEGAGFAGVIIPSRRAVGLTPAVHKASAGAVSRVPVARVGNLAQATQALHDAGFWLVGADAEGEKLPYEVDMARPVVVVIGSEGKGLSRLLKEHCDWVVRLPLAGELESLNASVAGGVLMYEAVRQRWAQGQSAD